MVRQFLGSTKVSCWLVLVGLGSPFYSELVSIEWGVRTDHGNFNGDANIIYLYVQNTVRILVYKKLYNIYIYVNAHMAHIYIH